MTMIPENISIETFRGCNARCIMCPVKDWAPPHGPMENKVFEKILRDMTGISNSLKSVALFGNGEPLLDKRLEERITACKSAGIPNVGFTSNGSLITQGRARKVVEAGTDWVVISFDSLDRDVYESIRVRLKHDRVLAGIFNLIEARDAYHGKMRISLRLIEQERNKGKVKDYLDFWSLRLNPNLDEIHFGQVHNWAQGPYGADFGDTPCGFVLHKSYILRDGKVVLCCTDYNAEYDFGNVMEVPLLELMNGPRWKAIRELHTSGRRREMNLCSTCDIPELNREQKLSVKMTPKGKVFSADALTPFENADLRGKFGEPSGSVAPSDGQ